MEIFVMLWVVEVVVAAKEKLNGPGSKNSRLDVNEPSSNNPTVGEIPKKCLIFHSLFKNSNERKLKKKK